MSSSGSAAKGTVLGGAARLAGLFVVLLGATAAWFRLSFLPREQAAALEAWSRDVGLHADVRKEALERYFADTLGDAATLASYPTALRLLEPGPGGGSARTASGETEREHLQKLLDDFSRGHRDGGVALTDAAARAAATSRGFSLDEGCAAAARAVMASAAPGTAAHLHAGLGPVLTFAAPVASAGGRALGAAVIAVDPGQWVYPLLGRPFAGASTGEAVLVARDGGEIVHLSPTGGRPDAPLLFRRPLASGFAARAVLGGSEFEGSWVDYRNVRVVGAVRRLAPTPWGLVVKVDEEEALAGFRERMRRTALGGGALLVAVAGVAWGAWQRRERRHQEALARSVVRMRSLFDGMLNGFAWCEMLSEEGVPKDFVYLEVNRAFEELTGLRNVVGKRVTEVIPGIREANPELFERYGRVASTGVPERFETFVPALGIWFSLSVYSPAKGHFVAVFDNITERKRAEEALASAQQQLLHAQKMEAVGRLAGGVAHDFNNLLTVIQGYGEALRRSLSGDEERRDHVAEILKAAGRASDLTRQLLAFGRRQVFDMHVLDLGAVVGETETMLRRLIGDGVELTVRRPDGPVLAKADAGQIEQVLLNLVVNARDATTDGGRIRVGVADRDLEAPLSSLHDTVPAGRYAVLSVADTGTGMDAGTLAHIFEPFFTTKEKGKGTGLGLSTVFGIVQQSNGHVLVESAPGRGTTFRLFFPRIEASAPAGSDDPAPPGTD